MSYNIPQSLLDMLQSGALPSAIKVVSNDPAGGAGAGEPADGTWANPYRTIQAAVDAMAPVDGADQNTWFEQIWIMSGIYNEDVTITKSKIMLFYTVGAARIGEQGDPKSVTWDKDAPTQITGAPPGNYVPASLIVLPMPQVGNTEITLFDISGDVIIDGDPVDRFCWFRNTNIGGNIVGKDAGQPTEWAGQLGMALVQSRCDAIQFGREVTYKWYFENSEIGDGVFVGGSEVGGERQLNFERTDVRQGTFTPNGLPMQTASVWAPEASDMIAIEQSRFEGAVTAREGVYQDSLLGGSVTLQDAHFTDSVFGFSVTVADDADKMRRCEFNGNVDVHDITLIEDCIFQANFENDSGNPDVKGCLFSGGVDFGSVGLVHGCRFNDTLDATSAEAYFLDCRVTGVVTFTVPGNFYVDLATNSMTKLAGSAFPAGTNLLNDAVIP